MNARHTNQYDWVEVLKNRNKVNEKNMDFLLHFGEKCRREEREKKCSERRKPMKMR